VDERRRSPRAQITCGCTLQRRAGAPVAAETVDIGPAGMCVRSQRPLMVDEVLRFELDIGCGGLARVMRQDTGTRYAMRFEQLPDEARSELLRLATASV
jgi:PilZ domain-containing protein